MNKRPIISSEANKSYLDLKKVNILGVNVVVSNLERVLEILEHVIRKNDYNKPFFVTTVNQEIVMLARKDARFRGVLNESDLAVADGVGLRLANSELEIVQGRILTHKLAEMKNYRIFFLGGQNFVAKMMKEKYGGEWDAGHSDIRSQMLDVRENQRIISKINMFKPDVLLVAYGAPFQEKWIFDNLDTMRCKVVIGVGGAFDYLSGRAKLPPEWMANVGLEWLWRLIWEPWRWRRQLRLVGFVWEVLKSKLV